MRDEFLIQRQGKTYVLFAGLLDEAHTRFPQLVTMSTELLELEPVPVVRAVFYGETGEGTSVRTSGIGTGKRQSDKKGSPGHEAPIEMAETRAKARALRDAVNVGVTAFEELGDEDSRPPEKREAPQEPAEVPERGPVPAATDEAAVSRSTVGKLRWRISRLGELEGYGKGEKEVEIVNILGFKLENLRQEDAEKYIRYFEREIEASEAQANEG